MTILALKNEPLRVINIWQLHSFKINLITFLKYETCTMKKWNVPSAYYVLTRSDVTWTNAKSYFCICRSQMNQINRIKVEMTFVSYSAVFFFFSEIILWSAWRRQKKKPKNVFLLVFLFGVLPKSIFSRINCTRISRVSYSLQWLFDWEWKSCSKLVKHELVAIETML